MRLRPTSSILALAAAFSLQPAPAADLLTLEQAIDIAMGQNRGLQRSAMDIEKAKEQLAANRTRQFPSFSVYALGAQQLRTFDFTIEKGALGTYEGGPLPSEDAHLTTPRQMTGLMQARIAQPLTSLIRIRRNLETLKTGVTLAAENTRSERQKLVRDVKRTYYSLQQVDSSLRAVRETAKLYEEIEKLTSNYVVQEVALRGDLLDAQTRLAKTQQLEVALINQRESAKEQLNYLLGRGVTTEFEVQPVLEITGEEPDLGQSRDRALKDRPEIRQAMLKQLQAEQDLRAKKAERIPDVSAELNSTQFMNWGRYMPTQSLSAGVSLSWEPFDWGRKKHETAEKERTVDQARIATLETESQVLADINDKYRQLQYRRTELRVARLAQETAMENLRVTKNKYLVEAALVKDVLQSQVSLEQSNTDYQQSLTSFWNARAEFERALGEDQ
jgi:outer membrane protein